MRNHWIAYLKRVWSELGGLPEDLTFYADDSVFGRQILQAGYKMAFAPEAMTYWSRPTRLKDFCRECFNYGRGDGEADIKKPYVVKLWQKGLIPGALVPTLNAFRILQKQFKYQPLAKAIKSGDLVAALFMPVFLLGRGYYFAAVYIDGIRRSPDKCKNCRQRLQPEFRQ